MNKSAVRCFCGVLSTSLIFVASLTGLPSNVIAQNWTARRFDNEMRYAKAEALAKSSDHQWTYIPNEGGSCRRLMPTTPFRFMQAVSAKRHKTPVLWDSPIDDENVERSIFANNNDPSVPLQIGPVQEFIFYITPEACDDAASKLLAHGGIKISDTDLDHKAALKWVITDQTTLKVACHWPNNTTGRSPREFFSILKQQGATISEVSHGDSTTGDHRRIFQITFAYRLGGHSNQISWEDLGDYSCDPKVRDRLILP